MHTRTPSPVRDSVPENGGGTRRNDIPERSPEAVADDLLAQARPHLLRMMEAGRTPQWEMLWVDVGGDRRLILKASLRSPADGGVR